jgi:hypothetical protein
MTELAALDLTARLLGLLALIQTFEFYRLNFATSNDGIWRWQDLENELGRPFRFLLSERSFFFLNLFRGLVAVDVLMNPHAGSVFLLFLIHVLTLLRWLGTFNGGSDYMCLMLLWLVSLGLWRQGVMAKVCVYYMAFQLCLSYFKAGYVKLRSSGWRSGRALPEFVSVKIYEKKVWIEKLLVNKPLRLAASWAIITYEMTFPLAVFNRNLALVYMICGCLFHLTNSYIFGLNRFFFA